jgi:hypothetical protein
MKNSYLEHPNNEALEALLLVRCSEQEQEAIETHFLACNTCIERLEILNHEIADLKRVLSQVELEPIQAEASPKRRFWENWFSIPTISWAGAAGATIAAVLTICPHFSTPSASVAQPTASALLSAYRGIDSTRVPRNRPWTLNLDASDIPQGRVDAELVTSAGRQLWHGAALVDNHEQTHISLNQISQPGTYFVRLYVPSAGERELLREFRFEVH